MGIEFLVPLIAGTIYATIMVITIFNRPRTIQHKYFIVYLMAAILWSLSDSLLRSDLLAGQKLLLFRIVVGTSTLWVIQLYCFSRSFLKMPLGIGAKVGYALSFLFIATVIAGFSPPSINSQGGYVKPAYGWWIILYVAPLVTMAVFGLFSLIKRLSTENNPDEYNKSFYLVAAMGFLISLGFLGVTPLASHFPVSHIGGLISACILAYVVVQHELISIRIVLRRLLGWLSVAFIGTTLYILALIGIHHVLGIRLSGVTIFLATLFAAGLSGLVYWLRPTFMRKLDQLFYRKRYADRKELFDFVTHRIRGVYNLQELGRGLLPPLVSTINSLGTYLLLPENNGEDFTSRFAEPESAKSTPLQISKDSPVVARLKHGYLTKDQMNLLPQMRGLRQDERAMIKSANIEMFFPLINRERLIGILALKRKLTGQYTLEDINLIESIASQVAISLEKEYFQHELIKREQELRIINRLSALMTSSLNLREVFRSFISGLKDVVEVDAAALLQIDGNRLEYLAVYSNKEKICQEGTSDKLEGSAVEWVAHWKKSFVNNNLGQDYKCYLAAKCFNIGIKSIVYVPLIIKAEVIGSLLIASYKLDAYSLERINLLERLASQIATSVVNAQLYTNAMNRVRTDELTGLYNRRHFDELIKKEISRHSRTGSMFSLIMMDLDNFKTYNDLKGHLAGDKVLKKIGNAIKDSIRNVDITFRYGGDEFSVLLPNTSPEDAFQVAERVRTAIETLMSPEETPMTLSLGLAAWPSDGMSSDEIISASDEALYHAKRTGQNRTIIATHMLPSLTNNPQGYDPLEKETLNTIYALAATIEARDRYTYGHSRKVRSYAVALAEAIGMTPERVAVISHAALLHDIGKIGILDGILNKPDALTRDEWTLIESHPQLSRTIVAHIPSLFPCLPSIMHHHEKWDGTGYPGKLKGNAIPIEARILAIADSFDAMTSERPYRSPYNLEEAISEMKRCKGTQFDPDLVDAFLSIVRETVVSTLKAQSAQAHR